MKIHITGTLFHVYRDIRAYYRINSYTFSYYGNSYNCNSAWISCHSVDLLYIRGILWKATIRRLNKWSKVISSHTYISAIIFFSKKKKIEPTKIVLWCYFSWHYSSIEQNLKHDRYPNEHYIFTIAKNVSPRKPRFYSEKICFGFITEFRYTEITYKLCETYGFILLCVRDILIFRIC